MRAWVPLGTGQREEEAAECGPGVHGQWGRSLEAQGGGDSIHPQVEWGVSLFRELPQPGAGDVVVTRSLVSPSYQAESCKKKISPKEEISLSTMELSGTVVKQDYLAKQVWYDRLGAGGGGQSSTSGRQEPHKEVGRAETPGH